MTALIVLSLCSLALGFMLGVIWDRWSAHRRFMARLAQDHIGRDRVRRAMEARLDIAPAIARSKRRQPIPLFPPGVK